MLNIRPKQATVSPAVFQSSPADHAKIPAIKIFGSKNPKELNDARSVAYMSWRRR